MGGRAIPSPPCLVPDGRRFCILPIAVARDGTLTDAAQAAARGIGTHTNTLGECWAGVGAIADEVGVSESTVKRGIRELIEAGYLLQKRRRRRTAILQWAEVKTGQPLTPLTASKTGQTGGQDRSNSPRKTGQLVTHRTSKGTSNLKERGDSGLSYESGKVNRPKSEPIKLSDILRPFVPQANGKPS